MVPGGRLVAASGHVLIFLLPIAGISGRPWAPMVRGVLSVPMVAAMPAHGYIGSLGMEDAFDAMGTGRVDWRAFRSDRHTECAPACCCSEQITPPDDAIHSGFAL